jgi:hypothetical protein
MGKEENERAEKIIICIVGCAAVRGYIKVGVLWMGYSHS